MINKAEKKRLIALASNAIGLGHGKPYKRHGRYFYRPYRNYYCASQESCAVWDLLVADGFAKAGEANKYGGRMYWLTRKGLDWLGNELGIVIHDEED